MKKIISIMLIMVATLMSISYASSGTKEATLNYMGITLNIDNVEVVPRDVNGTIVNPFTIDGTTYLPVRAISEALGKSVNWDSKTYTVSIENKNEDYNLEEFSGVSDKKISQEVKNLYYNDISIKINGEYINPKDANGVLVEPFIINGTTYLPVRAVAEAFDKKVSWNGETKTVFISSNKELAKINNVVLKVIDGVKCVEIKSDLPINEYKYYSLNEPNRIIIDLQNSSFNIDKAAQTINYEEIKQIRFGTQENNVSRIVLDLENISEYKVVQSEDRTTTYLALKEDFEISKNNEGSDSTIIASNDGKLYLPSGDKIDSGDSKVEEKPNLSGDVEGIDIEKLSIVNSIKYSSSTNKTKIKIDGNYEYNIFSLTNPDRVVLDITGARLDIDGPTTIEPNNKNITSIRFSQNEIDSVRVVFDVKAKSDYVVSEKNNDLLIEIEEKPYKNINYMNYNTYATLTLEDTDIDYFDTDKSSSGNKYYITFSSRKFKCDSDTIEVEDDFVQKIIIKSSKITIVGEEDIDYTIKQVKDDVVITMKEETKNNKEHNKVILVDAGHGGTDPGACNGTTYEKVYNLEIALKLYDMLKETDGIDVRISRTEDVFIDREGRRDFQLDNDDADLFVSVHNNSLANKNYQGTMVLFYNKPNEKEDYGITSKELAQIVKENIVEATGMIDRGVVSRDDIWVLEQNAAGKISSTTKEDRVVTNIPSILCEVCFISNDEEAARLKTEKFQQEVAQAIYDGIMEAIDVMDE